MSIAARVFSIPELLLLVLAHVSAPGKRILPPGESDALANFARVSRVVSDDTLSVLWRTIHRPDAIVKLLSSDAYLYQDSQYRLARPLTEDDFSIFDKYARRIRYVDFSNSSQLLTRGCELFPYIKAFRDPILPCLVDFRWEVAVANGSIGAFHLLSRTACLPSNELSLLMWSEIEYPPDEEISTALVQCIDLFNDPACPWMPDVKRLILRTLEYLPAVGSAVQGLSHLEHFSCDLCMDRELLNKLALLPRLKSIDLRWLLPDVARSLTPSRPGFAAIESFRLLGPIDSISATLPLITSAELTTVRLGIKGLELDGLNSSLIVLLVPPSVPTRTLSLRYFHLVGPSFRHLVASLPNHLALGDFAPLYSCHALETFWIDMSLNEVICTDADVHAMAEAWPKLIRLSINGPLRATANRSPPRAHLYTLWSLATNCPRLSDLTIEIDAQVTDPFYATTTSVVKGSEMEQVSFHFSPCSEPARVAAFLRVAFPGLSLSAFSAHSNSNNPEDQARWVDVGRMLE